MVDMNSASAVGDFEAQWNVDVAVIEKLDTLFPVEPPAKATGVFSSDCCSSNNYDQQN
jgi:hypothetical protein